ncbi:hypothetical protein DSUL_100173 [Desulfovibrionales bacterium]
MNYTAAGYKPHLVAMYGDSYDNIILFAFFCSIDGSYNCRFNLYISSF